MLSFTLGWTECERASERGRTSQGKRMSRWSNKLASVRADEQMAWYPTRKLHIRFLPTVRLSVRFSALASMVQWEGGRLHWIVIMNFVTCDLPCIFSGLWSDDLLETGQRFALRSNRLKLIRLICSLTVNNQISYIKKLRIRFHPALARSARTVFFRGRANADRALRSKSFRSTK